VPRPTQDWQMQVGQYLPLLYAELAPQVLSASWRAAERLGGVGRAHDLPAGRPTGERTQSAGARCAAPVAHVAGAHHAEAAPPAAVGGGTEEAGSAWATLNHPAAEHRVLHAEDDPREAPGGGERRGAARPPQGDYYEARGGDEHEERDRVPFRAGAGHRRRRDRGRGRDRLPLERGRVDPARGVQTRKREPA
jgi:hypothetical protein